MVNGARLERWLSRRVISDIPLITTLVRHAYGHYITRLGREPVPINDDYARLVRAGNAWVSGSDGMVAGVVVRMLNSDHVLVSNVAVARRHQGQGLGTALLAHAEDYARQNGVGELRLYTNELMHENLVIYSRLGWEDYDRVEQDRFRRVFKRKAVATA